VLLLLQHYQQQLHQHQDLLTSQQPQHVQQLQHCQQQLQYYQLVLPSQQPHYCQELLFHWQQQLLLLLH
jgi:hypothetical protein